MELTKGYAAFSATDTLSKLCLAVKSRQREMQIIKTKHLKEHLEAMYIIVL